MDDLDLEAATRQYLKTYPTQDGEIVIKSLNFGRVKLKEINMTWTDEEINPAKTGNTRVVNLLNSSSEVGNGHINIRKEGKPVFKFTLQEGVIKGLTNRVKFRGPSDVIREFYAPVNTSESLVQDHTGIKMETTVPMGSGTTARADVSNTSKMYIGKFEYRGKLSGKVIVERANGKVLDVPIESYSPEPVLLKGRIDVNFQDQHSITVNKSL